MITTTNTIPVSEVQIDPVAYENPGEPEVRIVMNGSACRFSSPCPFIVGTEIKVMLFIGNGSEGYQATCTVLKDDLIAAVENACNQGR